MRSTMAGLAVAVLVASCLPANAAVVVVKRDAGLSDVRGLDSSLADAITGGSATMYTGSGMVADAGLYTDLGWAQSLLYKNYGASTSAGQWGTFLVKFGLNALPGFGGSTVAKAELRFYTSGGNSGMGDFGRVTSSDWIEGTQADGYPGVAGGVSGAHPVGYNTDAYQMADGTPVDVGYPPNMSIAPFSWANDESFNVAKDAVVQGTGAVHNPWGVTDGQWDQYVTLDVTALLQSWAQGANNYGMFINNGNYVPLLSEETLDTNWQPVLVLDYAPVPEPASLLLLAVSVLGVARRFRTAS